MQKSEGGRLLKILTDKQFVTEQDMTFSMGRCLNTPPINLAKLRVPEEIMSLVPRDMARTNKLVPIARLEREAFRGHGRPDERARGRRPKAARRSSKSCR